MQMNRMMTEKKTKTIPVTAAGGAVYHQNGGEQQVLLILKNDCWDLPKGKLEANESMKECAKREVSEETGLKDLTVEGSLIKTVHTYRRNGKKYRKTTHWFKMRGNAEETLNPQANEGIEQARWVTFTQAKNILGYDNLKKVLAAL